MTHWDAVVVGAGPAGAATALLLARTGARVLLLDRARFPRDKPCSEYLSPGTTRVLERLGGGVLESVAAASHARLTGMKVVAPSGAEMIGRFDRAGRTGHALRQYLECRRALVDGLGIEPAEATSRLQARVLAGESV